MDYPLPQDKDELDALNIRLQQADPVLHLEESSFTDYRKVMFSPGWFTNTVCGNCRSVCWAKREDREENRRLIVNAGIVALNPDGEHIVTKEEIVEVNTPYIVRVALPKKEYEIALASAEAVDIEKARTPMDTGVLSHIFHDRNRV